MDPRYQNFHNQVRQLQFRFHDVLDKPDHPEAQTIRSALQHLEDDVQSGKNPNSIEERIKTAQRQLQQARHASDPIMDASNNVELYEDLEHMRRDIRSW